MIRNYGEANFVLKRGGTDKHRRVHLSNGHIYQMDILIELNR